MFLSELTNYSINIIISIFLLILSYIIGSIPFGLVFGKLICKKDIREYGSKNIGSTNAIRVLGKKVGFLVFFFDVFKGMVIIILVKILNVLNVWNSPIEELWYGAIAIIGHSFSIFLKFKGGKAVATSLGVVLMTCPLAGILCLIMFGIFFYTTGYVSIASTAATLTVLITGWVLHFVGITPTDFFNYFIGKTSDALVFILSFFSVLILLKHIKNYKRLANGTENSFKKKKDE